jgi:hypothetical protein
MLEARELRIGNLVTINNNGSWPEMKDVPVFVTGVSECQSLNDEDGTFYSVNVSKVDIVKSTYSQFIKFIEPIPLTEEWLERFGFKVFPWGWVKKSNKDFGVRLRLTSFSYEVSGNNAVLLVYAHQLQNLFYALTGEELELKY